MPSIRPDASEPDQCLTTLETIQLVEKVMERAARGDAAPDEIERAREALAVAIADLGGEHPNPADCLSAGACAWCERAAREGRGAEGTEA